MTIARSRQICLKATPYYHCVSRCVRRAFLCGADRLSGKSFEHRRGWIEQRLERLALVFAIDLCAYAIMSNHFHVVVRIDQARARAWSDDEVIHRWLELYRGPPLARRWLAGEANTEVQREAVREMAAIWRERLTDLGWFMRNINEPIAREANAEDGCKGRFWEGRYKCQALLDNKALLTCMAYVDLNPVRAGTANTPEESIHTTIKARLDGRDSHLLDFQRQEKALSQSRAPPIPYAWRDYLELIDWTGRAIRHGKRGHIDQNMPPILERLQQPGKLWITEIQQYGNWYGRAVGAVASMQAYCEATGTRWVKGVTVGRQQVAISPT